MLRSVNYKHIITFYKTLIKHATQTRVFNDSFNNTRLSAINYNFYKNVYKCLLKHASPQRILFYNFL